MSFYVISIAGSRDENENSIRNLIISSTVKAYAFGTLGMCHSSLTFTYEKISPVCDPCIGTVPDREGISP